MTTITLSYHYDETTPPLTRVTLTYRAWKAGPVYIARDPETRRIKFFRGLDKFSSWSYRDAMRRSSESGWA